VKTENMLYAIGIIAAVVGVLYFTWEYIARLSELSKFVIIMLIAVIFIAAGNYVQGRPE
jgi:hypothetical protein